MRAGRPPARQAANGGMESISPGKTGNWLRLLVCAWAIAAAAAAASAQSEAIPYNGPALSLKTNQTCNVNAADTVNADQLWSGGGLGLNLNGADLTVGIWDGGYVRATHQELTGRVTVMDAGYATADHATHVAGTIGATGVVAAAHGMANQVQIRSYDWDNDMAEMAAAAPSIVASNHSYSYTRGWSYTYVSDPLAPGGTGNYGIWYADRALYTEDPGFGKYDADTQALDQVLYNNPKLLSVWAASNDRGEDRSSLNANYYITYLSSGGSSGPGFYYVPKTSYPVPGADGSQGGGYDCLPQQQTAKNTLVVGAINDITADPYTAANVTMTSFSSWGTTDDGRIKPDVVANGASLYSSFSSSDSAYGTMSGTSMAAPNVTGTATLLIQHHEDLYNTLPRSATTKALIIHTALDAGNAGPDPVYGWGVMDAAKAAVFQTSTTQSNSMDRMYEETYGGSVWTLLLYSDGTGSLKATLVWTDPAAVTLPGDGLDDTTPVLVNDLDLKIMAANSTVYYPWTLVSGDPSQPAARTLANHLDNIEQVLIDLPAAGWYTLSVSGGAFTQDFSLLVSGAVPEPATLSLLFIGGLAVLRRRRA